MENYDWCVYTYRHWLAFEYCVKKLITDPELRDRMLARARVHDMDKMLMYLFLPQHDAQMIHVQRARHHLENDLPKSDEDIVETVIDYECAPYTKPDKPLNAYDFVRKFLDRGVLDEETGRRLLAVMEELGIARSGTVEEDEEGRAYMEAVGEVSPSMLEARIRAYLREDPCGAQHILEELGKTPGDAEDCFGGDR